MDDAEPSPSPPVPQRACGGPRGPPCTFCGASAPPAHRFANCGRCRAIAYCGRACQRADWPVHRALCGRICAATSHAAVEVEEEGADVDDPVYAPCACDGAFERGLRAARAAGTCSNARCGRALDPGARPAPANSLTLYTCLCMLPLGARRAGFHIVFTRYCGERCARRTPALRATQRGGNAARRAARVQE